MRSYYLSELGEKVRALKLKALANETSGVRLFGEPRIIFSETGCSLALSISYICQNNEPGLIEEKLS